MTSRGYDSERLDHVIELLELLTKANPEHERRFILDLVNEYANLKISEYAYRNGE